MNTNKIKLDIGCGKNKLDDYIGVDINPDSGADIIASALALPFDNESIDEIYSAHLVEHFSPPEAQIFFDEIYRALKTGGTAVLKIDCDWSKKRLLKKDVTHKHRFEVGELEFMVRKFSWAEVKKRIYFVNPLIPKKKIFVLLRK